MLCRPVNSLRIAQVNGVLLLVGERGCLLLLMVIILRHLTRLVVLLHWELVMLLLL